MRALRVGLIGAGGFARFWAESTGNLEGLRVAWVHDQDEGRATSVAGLLGAAVAASVETAPEVDAVVIATPPASHAGLALGALARGWHVFCEKPVATSLADARAVVRAAVGSGRVVVVDHVIHYNPLIGLLVRLREAGVLGEVQRFCFENDAGDGELGPRHWFWDIGQSGGILVEHGVHFFDVAEWLIGSPPLEVQALGASRADGRIDLVSATVRHRSGALASHTHGFCHPNHAERQFMRVDFGYGHALLEGWIPVVAHLDAWVDDAGLAVLEALPGELAWWLATPGTVLTGLERSDLRFERNAHPGPSTSRDTTRVAPHHVHGTVDLGGPAAKQGVYAASVRSATADFLHAIRTGAPPLVDAHRAGSAVAVAVAATAALSSGDLVSVGSVNPPGPPTPATPRSPG